MTDISRKHKPLEYPAPLSVSVLCVIVGMAPLYLSDNSDHNTVALRVTIT